LDASVNKVSRVLTFIACASGLVADYYLFFIPAFKHYVGVYVDTPPPPRFEPAWDFFTFNQNANIFSTLAFFLSPLILASIGLFVVFRKRSSHTKIMLWILTGLATIATWLAFPDLGVVFLPTAAFLLAAAISETRKPNANAVHGSISSPRMAA
jgi:hypothetical protein